MKFKSELNVHKEFDNDLLEKKLYEFESKWFNDHQVSIEEFLPETDHPHFNEILVELIRSHIELTSETETPSRAADFFEKFPQLNQDESARKSIVFEEYRQAINRGEDVSIEHFGKTYGVDFSTFHSNTPSSSASRNKIEFPRIGEVIGGFKLIGLLGRGA